ncbi:hypothetical protein A2154_02795 [Candidatus Gottesmanbacteria bacterium RBG_16_43_7]|uniref:Uncharacterized protein n=1 Tax=Candidatus Gottesmanbacteria bacterium RBG_16_43_7 TaxID=1798373 RepID=A0A1F5Z9Z4_9BACT|nr:MAG: hypothetical protein A2154_02795 [Candidatus Gottesmanbacteria bacterium RBG_16_43_7]
MLEVEKVTRSKYFRLREGAGNLQTVEWGKFSEFGNIYPLANEKASPCLIVYVYDESENRILSGHFAEADPDRYHELFLENLRQVSKLARKMQSAGNICVPPAKYIPRLTNDNIDGDYQEFIRMVDRMRKLVAISGRGSVTVYLFGQNFPLYDTDDEKTRLSDLTGYIREYYWVKAQFTDAGMLMGDIYDFRQPGIDAVDHTLFLPRKGVIYHYRQKECEE